MDVQGVIADSIISFKMSWYNQGTGQNKFDQNDQYIEIHTTDIYPDLLYTTAYGAPKYLKYTSAPLLNGLFNAVNSMIDLKLGKTNEAIAIGQGETGDSQKSLPSGPPKNKALPSGPEKSKALGAGTQATGTQSAGSITSGPKYDIVSAGQPNLPSAISNKDEEPPVTPDEPKGPSSEKYKVTVYGQKLRFLEAQQERGAYSGGIKFIYKVSNNLIKSVGDDPIDNTDKIWAEIDIAGRPTIRMEFEDFNQSDLKFGGNLLVQVFPSIELSFTPDQNSVYAREAPEIDFADILKSTKITLGGKTNDEIIAIQKEIQNELEVRQATSKTATPNKSSQDENK
jgi:hypothetical protein